MRADEKKLLAHAMEKRIKRLRIILQQDSSTDSYSDRGPEHDESARLDNLSHQQVDETLIDLARRELNTLSKNLNWLDQDDAGECEECGREIPVQRLLAVPTTRLCIACAVETV